MVGNRRNITSIAPDPTALKALAHPLRLRMLGLLRIDGPATASGLAERLAHWPGRFQPASPGGLYAGAD